MSLSRLIEGLAEADIECVVVGMVAGQFYGSRIATFGLDIVYDVSPENRAKLSRYMNELDAYVKETWPNEGVSSEFSEDVLAREGSVTLGTFEGEIDLLDRIDGIGSYPEVAALSRPMKLGNGLVARMITLSGLIASKRASDREKDRLHVIELEAIERLDRLRDATS